MVEMVLQSAPDHMELITAVAKVAAWIAIECMRRPSDDFSQRNVAKDADLWSTISRYNLPRIKFLKCSPTLWLEQHCDVLFPRQSIPRIAPKVFPSSRELKDKLSHEPNNLKAVVSESADGVCLRGLLYALGVSK
jgi:hypothetical protein